MKRKRKRRSKRKKYGKENEKKRARNNPLGLGPLGLILRTIGATFHKQPHRPLQAQSTFDKGAGNIANDTKVNVCRAKERGLDIHLVKIPSHVGTQGMIMLIA